MDDRHVFEALGFQWDRRIVPRNVPVYSVERAAFRLHKALAAFVWDASTLEGNPFTFPEVQTLLDGITVGGHKVGDERQVLNLADSAKDLLVSVKAGKFALDKKTSDHLHAVIARDEAFDAGFFRGEGTERRLTPGQYGTYQPPPTEPDGGNLRDLYQQGLEALGSLDDRFEEAVAYFLFAALQQFYFDGNKRTGRYMMNGHLMSAGIDAISIPAARAQEFNSRMVDFYRSKEATGMVAFLIDCHPDRDEIIDQGVLDALRRT